MGNGLQGGGALIGKPHAHKEPSLLQGRKERQEMSFYCCKIHGLGAGLLLYCEWRRLGGAWERGYSYTASGRDWEGPGSGATPILQVADTGSEARRSLVPRLLVGGTRLG